MHKKKLFWILLFSFQWVQPFLVVIDIPGSLYKPGRTVWDAFERGILFNIAQEIKQVLHDRESSIVVRISDVMQKEDEYYLHKAQRYNVLAPDLLLFFGAYQDESEYRISIYNFVYDSFAFTPLSHCVLYPYQKSYLLSYDKTVMYAESAKTVLSRDEYAPLFGVEGPFSFPVKPLIGLMVPALMIELGIMKQRDEHIFIEPLVEMIEYLSQTQKSYY